MAAHHPSEVSAGAPVLPQHPLDRPIAAVRRYKWLIIAVVVVAAVLGIVGSRMIVPQYDVKATVWIESETPQENNNRVGPIRSGELLRSSAWIELLRSYRVVDAVVRKLALFLETSSPDDLPLFANFVLGDRFIPGRYELLVDRSRKTWTLFAEDGVQVAKGAAQDSVGVKLGLRWVLPDEAFRGAKDRRIKFTVITPRETSARLLSRLQTRLALGSNFLWLTYQDPDPQLAARTLNVWVTEFLRVAEDLKKRNVVEYANILDGQLKYAERATQDAETAYENFRVHTITLPTESGPMAAGVIGDRDPALSGFFDQKIAYDNIRRDREAVEKAIASASAAIAPYEGLLLIPSVAQSPGAEPLREAFKTQYQLQARLVAERQNFTDAYPTVKELLAGLNIVQHQTIPRLANQLAAQLRDRESDYAHNIAGASRELQQIPPRTIESMRLKRAVNVAEGLYTNLKSRYAEAKLAEASATADVTVLDTAIAPLAPSRNTAPKVILIAIVGGLAAAIGLALLLDMVDRRIRYSHQATTELGLVVAGTIPRIPKGGIGRSSPEQVMQFVESIRSLRMHVMHSTPEGQSLAVAITSPAPGDGKSLVSANLALSFAEAGHRTLLVDGDTRRGELHRMFAMKAAGGLTEYLLGSVAEHDVVRATSHQNLWLVTSGARHSRSPELLTSPRLRNLVSNFSNSFDVIVFDTPPLAAGIDGYAICAAAGNVLMVLRIGQTERRLAASKLAVLDRLPVNIFGAVLNGVKLEGEFQYYAFSPGYSIDRGEAVEELVQVASK